MSFTVERDYGYYSTADALVIPAKEDLKKCELNQAIFKDAGNWALSSECRRNKGHKLGDAVITEGYKTKFKFLIHAICLNNDGSYSDSTEVIHNCYRSILDVAASKGITSLAVPALAESAYISESETHTIYSLFSDKAANEDLEITWYVGRGVSTPNPESAFPGIDTYIETNFKPVVSSGPTIRFSKSKKVDVDFSSAPMSRAIKEIDQRLEEKRDSFSDYLLQLAEKKNLSNVDLYTKANISKQQFSRIISNTYYTPQKKTIFAFAIALKLSRAETEELLKKAGHAFSETDKSDVIVSYFLEKHIYDIFEINEALFYYDQPLLGSGM